MEGEAGIGPWDICAGSLPTWYSAPIHCHRKFFLHKFAFLWFLCLTISLKPQSADHKLNLLKFKVQDSNWCTVLYCKTCYFWYYKISTPCTTFTNRPTFCRLASLKQSCPIDGDGKGNKHTYTTYSLHNISFQK